MKQPLRWLLALLLTFGLWLVIRPVPTPTRAAGPWYVATTGDNANACLSAALPCATINGALSKPGFVAGDTIRVATGTYTSANGEVVLMNKSATVSGGWNSTFTAQTGWSTVDGENARRGVTVNSGVTATVERFIIQHGYAGSGSGIDNSGTLTLTYSRIQYNGANVFPTNGGGISNVGTLSVISSTINNNVAFGFGGGLYNSGLAAIHSSEVSNNAVNTAGGGIFSNNSLVINNSTLTGNGAAISAAGLVRVNSSTISHNYYGGLADTNGVGADISVQNSILAFNDGFDCVGTIHSGGHNILNTTNGCNFVQTTGDLIGSDPRLGELVGTPAFYPLQLDSPAVDAGDPAGCQGSNGLLTTDQRGVPRDAHCDIGAFEYATPGAPADLSIVNPFVHFVPPNTPDPHPLKVRVLDNQGNLVHNALVTFTAPSSGASGTFATTGTRTATAITDNSGVATAPVYTANHLEGEYTLGAAVTGALPVAFTVHNVVWYLSAQTGSRTNNCTTPATPCRDFWQLLAFSALEDLHIVRVASGIYTGTEATVAPIDRSLTLSGGWNTAFTAQTGASVIDGEHARNGLEAGAGLTITLDHFSVRNALSGVQSAADSLSFTQGDIRDNAQRGVAVTAGHTRLTNVTLGGNQGGGLSVSTGSTVTLASSTIANNRADVGAGVRNLGGTINIKNSIVANNLISTTGGVDCAGTVTSGGYNLIGDTNNCTFISTTGDQLNVDPDQSSRLLGLPGYYALRSTSPAIEAADPTGCTDANGALLAIDIRGLPREGRCDIGAYEYLTPTNSLQLLILSGTPQTARPTELFPNRLSAAVLDDHGTPVAGVAVTFTAPGSSASGVFTDTQAISTTVISDLDGVATAAPFQANAALGEYHVTAIVAGLAPIVYEMFNSAALYVAPAGNDANSCLLSNAPCATLNGALDKASGGEDILVAGGTYIDTGEAVAVIERDVQISGGWNAAFSAQTETSILDGQGQRRGVKVQSGIAAALENVIIQNGNGYSGGGLYNAGQLAVISVTLQNNTCADTYSTSGGAIYNIGTLNVSHSVLMTNTCAYAGAILNDVGGMLTLADMQLIGHSAYQQRGGIGNYGTLTVTTVLISGTSLSGLTTTGSAVISDTQFLLNSGSGLVNTGQLTLINSTFISNTGSAGAGLNNTGWANVQSTRFVSNTASIGPNQYGSYALGGGVYNSGHLIMDAGVIVGNQSAETVVYYNQSSPMGGGLANRGMLTVTNSLIANNRVSMWFVPSPSPGGGGVYQDSGQAVFVNSTIANNQALAQGTGGGVRAAGGTLTLQHTIIADNTADNGGFDCGGTIDSGGYNLIGQLNGCQVTAATGDVFSQTARLNAPPTATGYVLNYDSPAINAGDPAGCTDVQGAFLTHDLRGLPRPVGRCDIGAVEMQALEASAVLVSRNHAINRTPISYTLQLRNLADVEVASVVVTDRVPGAVIYQANSLTATQGTPLMAGDVITWTGTLPASTTVNVVFGATVSPAAIGGSWITNTAYVQWGDSTITPSGTFRVMSDLYLPAVAYNFCGDFTDDFSTALTRWPVSEDAYLRTQYLNGEYQMLSKAGGYFYGLVSPACAQDTYRVEVTARWASAASSGDGYAVLFDIAPDLSRYGVFYVSADYGDFTLYYRDAGGVHQIMPFTASAAIQRGSAANRLTVIRTAQYVTLRVNDVPLGTWWYGPTSGATRAGLAIQPYATRPQADARFDDFSVRRQAETALFYAPTPELQASPVISTSPAFEGLAIDVWRQGAWSVRQPIEYSRH